LNIQNFFFTYRSYTPIPIALAILYFASVDNAVFYLGFPLLFLGEIIRIWAVSYAGGATRTTEVGAPFLCTSGPYARVRNPLYIGNMIIYTAFALIAGAEILWATLGMTWAFFLVQYFLIVSLEEKTLETLFGNTYNLYRKNVPSLLPRIRPWKPERVFSPSPLGVTLKTEKRTLQNITIVLLLLFLRFQI
jgi:protein-S-isoprenylcysteine O-methyltransferase Ste14